MSVQIRIDGQWLTALAPWGELTWSWTADGGCETAQWSMHLPSSFVHPLLRRGRRVQILLGATPVWCGELAEPEQTEDGWTLHAQGLAAAYRGWACLTTGGDTTSRPDTAIDAAIARGLPWTRPTSLSGDPFAATDQTDALNKVGDLLDAWADSVGQRWGVDEQAQVYARADDTTPSWHMTPGSGRYGLADDSYASRVFVRYQSGPTSYATKSAEDTAASAAHGTQEHLLDATGYGIITPTVAQSIADAAITKGAPLLGWTNPVTPSSWQLTTPGGEPACLPLVRPQQVVRLHGVLDTQGRPQPHVDFAIGKTSYADGAPTITLTPIEAHVRDVASTLQELVA